MERDRSVIVYNDNFLFLFSLLTRVHNLKFDLNFKDLSFTLVLMGFVMSFTFNFISETF